MIKTAFSNRMLVVMALLGSVILFTSMKPSGLSVNLRENPLGIDSKPYFSWDPGVSFQGAYRIQVAFSENALAKGDLVWDSGKVVSDKSVMIPFPVALESAKTYYWKVQTWDNRGKAQEWSTPSTFETGLLDKDSWRQAAWIGGRPGSDNDWTDFTATVKFKINDPATGLTFLFHAEPEGKAWDEAYVWKIMSAAGKTTAFRSGKAGDEVVFVNAVENFREGDIIPLGGKNYTVASIGTAATISTISKAASSGQNRISYMGGFSMPGFPGMGGGASFVKGDSVIIGEGADEEVFTVVDVEQGAAPAAGGMGRRMSVENILVLSSNLSKSHPEGARLAKTGTGIRLTAPLAASLDEGAPVEAKASLQLSMAAKHYAGNTGVPSPGPGDEPVRWGINYYDSQSETNPLAVGNRLVPIAEFSASTIGGMTLDNFKDSEHTLQVIVEGDRVTTCIDGVEVDSRILKGDQLRERGTIGFQGGGGGGRGAAAGPSKHAYILSVDVQPSDNPVSGGATNVFHTDFGGGFNPFEAGHFEEGKGFVVEKMPMLPIANPAPRIRKEFTLKDKSIAFARAYIAGGSYPRTSINGKLLTIDGELPDEDLLNVPRLTPDDGQIDDFVLYNTFDITKFLRSGKNAVGIELGRSWNGITSPNEWFWQRIPTNGDPRTKVLICVTYTDGTVDTIVSDGSWKTTDGPISFDSVYSGEKFDARIEKAQRGWDQVGFNDSGWTKVTRMNPVGSYFGTGIWHGAVPSYGKLLPGFKESRLKAMENEPILVRQILKPDAIYESYPGSGVYVYEFHQMHTGFTVLNLKNVRASAAGSTIRMRGDNLKSGSGTQADPYTVTNSSNFFQNEIQVEYYTLSDEPAQKWRPYFHYNGQGAIEVRGLKEVLGRAPTLDDEIIYVEVASSEFPRNNVTTDNTLLNDIAAMCTWTMLNDAHAHPTDCPGREKNGWTGDGWADSEAWCINFDVMQFYRLWQRDIIGSQAPSGEINVVVPAPRGYGYEQTPGWANANGPVLAWDNAIFEVPLLLYQYYGDTGILEESYPAQEKIMKYYSNYLKPENNYSYSNVRGGLAEYAAGVSTGGQNDASIINHQLYIHEADYMIKIGEMLGKDVSYYKRLKDDLIKTFIREYWNEQTHTFSKGTTGNLHTEQIMAIAYDMVPGSDLPAGDPRYLSGTQSQKDNIRSCASLVTDDMKNNGNRIGVGVYGLHYMFPLLADMGYSDLLFEVMTGLENPSWGNILLQGGSTLQENWGGINGNHHYHSSAMTWFYQVLAGIMPTSPAYATVRIKPFVPTVEGNCNVKGDKKPLENVSGTIHSARGDISSSWTNYNQFRLDVVIPNNTKAEVWVPAVSKASVTAPKGASFLRESDGYCVYSLGGGSYSFVAPKVK